MAHLTARQSRLEFLDGGQPPRRGAFTLVELLVVIGIIALLIALLLPALSRVRDQANTIKCLSIQRQLMTAVHMYTADNDGWMPFCDWDPPHPPAGWSPTPPGWLYTKATLTFQQNDVQAGVLYLYLQNPRNYRCPSDDGPWPVGTIQNLTSYLMNGAFSGFGTEYYNKITKFPNDSVVFWEMDSNNASAGNDGSSFPYEPITHRHVKGTTISYIDGHAEILSQTEWNKLLFQDPLTKVQYRDPGPLYCEPK